MYCVSSLLSTLLPCCFSSLTSQHSSVEYMLAVSYPREVLRNILAGMHMCKFLHTCLSIAFREMKHCMTDKKAWQRYKQRDTLVVFEADGTGLQGAPSLGPQWAAIIATSLTPHTGSCVTNRAISTTPKIKSASNNSRKAKLQPHKQYVQDEHTWNFCAAAYLVRH